LGDLVGISPRFLAPENYTPWSIIWRCLCYPRFNHLYRTAQLRLVTDRQTYDDSIYRASIESRGNKTIVCHSKRNGEGSRGSIQNTYYLTKKNSDFDASCLWPL